MRDHNAFERQAGSFGAWPEEAAAAPDDRSGIRTLVGEAGWRNLSPAVRERFAVSPAPGEVWHFKGAMDVVDCNTPGRAMAWASRLIGAPVAHRTGRGVAIDVFVYVDEKTGGTVWERRYGFAGTSPVTACTAKRIDAEGRMRECFGLGFGMELDVYEHNAALYFHSTSFYLDIAGRRLRLPHVLSPGTLLVEHIDEGAGAFRFRMTVDHPLMGRVFFQDGVFQKVEE